jgi:DNA-directed RNA polymerase specialized sigma24 family protein
MVKILQAFRTVADLERDFGALFEAVVRYVTARGDYSVQEAEDAAMDATEAILTRLKAGETVDRPRAWASSFAWYEVAKRRRAHARLTRRATQGAPYSRKGAQRASQVQPEQMAAVRDLLSAKEYVALAVRMSGMSYREGASALGISQSAFTGRVASAHRKLRHAAKRSQP